MFEDFNGSLTEIPYLQPQHVGYQSHVKDLSSCNLQRKKGDCFKSQIGLNAMYIRGRVDFISKMLSFLCRMQVVLTAKQNCHTDNFAR